MSVLIDDVDLNATLGFIESDIPDLRDSPDTEYALATVPGRPGAVHVSAGDEGQVRERRITIEAACSAASHAAVLANVAGFKRRIHRREVKIQLGDDLSIHWLGRPERMAFPTIAPMSTQRMIRVQWSFLLADPYGYGTVRSISFAGGATELPLGPAPSYGEVTLQGVTNPILIYRNHLGVERGRLALIGTVPGGSTLYINMRDQRILLDGADAYDFFDDALTQLGDAAAGDFFAFDPRDGSLDGADGPTLQCLGSPSAAVTEYTERW